MLSALQVRTIAHHRGRLYIVVQQLWNDDYRGETEETQREIYFTVTATASTANLS